MIASSLDRFVAVVRYAVRSLRRSRAFSATVVIVLAMGIAVNTAMFSVVDRVLLRQSRYPDAARLVLFGYTFQGAWVPWASEAKFNVWREQADEVATVAAVRFGTVDLTDPTAAEQISVARVTSTFLPLIGAAVADGRSFDNQDDRVGRDAVVILSDAFWRRRYGARHGIVGQTIPIDGRALAIVGIAAASVDTTLFGVTPELWLPLQIDRASTSQGPSMRALARLKHGVTLEVANDRAVRAGEDFRRQFPDVAGAGNIFALQPLVPTMVRPVRTPLLVLVAAMGFLLLIACANVVNLMFVRASVRQRDFAIRAAIGASRAQLALQWITESVLLALGGGMLGLAAAAAGMKVLAVMDPGGVISTTSLSYGDLMTLRVGLFCLIVSLVTGIGCGCIPAAATLRRTAGPMRTFDNARTGTNSAQDTARSALVVVETTLAVVLLIGAILLVRTFVALRSVDRGFDASQVVTARMSLSGARIADEFGMARFVRERIDRIASLPGVAVAAASCCMPLESDWRASIVRSDQLGDPASALAASERVVSAGYFEALGIRMTAGRSFTSADGPDSQPIAIVDETLARRLWPGGSAIGAALVAFPGLSPTTERPRQIVGIVRNVRDGMPLDHDARPTVYVPLTQMEREQAIGFAASQPLVWLVRAQSDARTIAAAVQSELRRLNQSRPVTDNQSLVDVVERSTDGTRFYTSIVALFAGLGLALASVGLYAVTMYSVQQRTRELAIRLALGADPRRLRNIVMAQGLRLALSGAMLGLLLASGLVRFLESELFGVAPHDLLSFLLVPLVLTATAAAAVSAPAHRATRLDPMTTLRAE